MATKSLYKDTFKFSDLMIEMTKNKKPKVPENELVFGKTFSDHMFLVEWKKDDGWGIPTIIPYGNLNIEPSAQVFHYGIECFEGMKAFKDSKGQVRLFRPNDNMKRFFSSAERLALPTFDKNELLDCLKKLVIIDKEWIPSSTGYSLYIRPTLISSSRNLGVSPPSKALLFIILSPVGPYYSTGFKPVSLLVPDTYVRAWIGGTGRFKAGCNYAPTIKAQMEAEKKGHNQVLWHYNGQVSEVGSMNFFLFWKNKKGEKELITPSLVDGIVLPGVIRQSILDLTRKWGEFKVSEANFTIEELITAVREKRVIEAFGSGTSAVIAPVKGIEYKERFYDIPVGKGATGELAQRLWDSLIDIQYGKVQSEWSVVIN